MPKWAKYIHLAVLWGLCVSGFAMVPPHPMYGDVPSEWEAVRISNFRNIELEDGNISTDLPATSPRQTAKTPSNILALMVEFSDVSFITEPQYPDFMAHDLMFFERWMLHLSDFFADASHGAYEMNYTVYPQVFQLPRAMAYYGGDSPTKTDARLPEILPDLMPLCAELINFNDYDGVIIFHAGAGQEADIERIRTDSIWSTFLTRRALQAAFDPENDDYPGFETPDGAILTNVVIVPEDEYHDYFPAEGEENAEAYHFSIYGVLAHQFGHVLGLPTLFDNDSSNGASQGIGNWGLMGTGVWNASGYVPAQLSAWCRYYLGWEEPITITEDSEQLPLDHFLNHQQDAIRLYKVPISEREYFLVENRQQNPDGSLDPYSNLPSYSFKLLPDGEQDYYEDYPDLPYFNFMENRYSGSEWDFFLPGFGQDPTTDGSGILIWHIDEHIIAENFIENFDSNRVNANALHKGVDLEEADGYQHLDTALMSDYKYGGPEDSYRADNNDYFGNGIYDGLLWLPTSESYYGGIPLELFDISASANEMSFSVRFAWRLETLYDGPSLLPAAAIDFTGDGQLEVFYPMADGKLSLFANDTMADGFPVKYQDIVQLYTWDGSDLYIPMQNVNLTRLAKINDHNTQFVLNLPDHSWQSHPVDIGESLYLPLKDEQSGVSSVKQYHKDGADLGDDVISFEGEFMANLSWTTQRLYALSLEAGESQYRVWEYDADSQNLNTFAVDIPADSLAIGMYTAVLSDELNLIVQCPSSVYAFDLTAGGATLRTGFPFVMPDSCHAPITIQDWDSNGSLDLILGRSNRVFIVDHSASDMSTASLNPGLADDGISAGALALDLDGDGSLELVAPLSLNRLVAWEQDQRLKRYYPVSFGNRGRHLPFVYQGSDDNYYLYIASDDGNIFRNLLPDYDPAKVDTGWICEYGNLQRTAFREASTAQNQYQSSAAIVKDELYIYPNPLKQIYEPTLRLSVMPTQDMEIELAIYDISGNMVYKHQAMAYAYLRNLEIFEIPAAKLSSGIYLAIVKGGGEKHLLRFGIEK